jgi:hypothetical protein
MTCSRFGFNAIVLTHLFEFTFEFVPIVKDNKLRTGITCQSGIMKQILGGSSRFGIGLDNLKPSSGWINHSESKQRVYLEWGLYGRRTHQI